MKKNLLLVLLLSLTANAFAQNYVASMTAFQKKYVKDHEVVEGKDKKYFRFFPVDEKYKVSSHFEKISDTVGFTMKTSSNTLKKFYKYGKVTFVINDTDCTLFVYQNEDLMQVEKYTEYLFIPYTDLTSGNESYGSGRYLEFYFKDIKNNTLEIDFNKAYNPYCAYKTGFRCPIPPKENHLNVAIKAGERTFAKAH